MSKPILRNRTFSVVALVAVAVLSAAVGVKVVHRSRATNTDINGDGKVDIIDLGILAGDFGKTGQTFAQGDMDGNGNINIIDLGIFASKFGTAYHGPFGKKNFVVSAGGFNPGTTDNWVRLGTYTFNDDGTVQGSWWRWNMTTNTDVRTSTGITATNCGGTATCQVLTDGRYLSATNQESLSGTWRLIGQTSTSGTLTVTWAGNQIETWDLVENPSGNLVRLDSAGSNYGLTNGSGYGSNAALSQRVSMTQIMQSYQKTYTTHVWGIDGNATAGFTISAANGWQVCSGGQCMAYDEPPNTPNCSCGPGGALIASERYYYVASLSATDRRDTLWLWCKCLADGRGETCYTGNSHIDPMMQVIDDSGGFHGWVGIEASYPAGGGPVTDANMSVRRTTDF